MAPIPARSLPLSDKINVISLAIASVIGLAALLIGYAGLKLQRYFHHRAHPRYELPGHELEAALEP
jgi:hypothetical protein